MTDTEITKAKEDIDKMSQIEMARLWRFAPSGHPYFDSTNGDLFKYFKKKFKEKGWFTPAVSKAIGW
jgi:hypothetical protein